MCAPNDIIRPLVEFFDGTNLHKEHFALSLLSFEAAPYKTGKFRTHFTNTQKL